MSRCLNGLDPRQQPTPRSFLLHQNYLSGPTTHRLRHPITLGHSDTAQLFRPLVGDTFLAAVIRISLRLLHDQRFLKKYQENWPFSLRMTWARASTCAGQLRELCELCPCSNRTKANDPGPNWNKRKRTLPCIELSKRPRPQRPLPHFLFKRTAPVSRWRNATNGLP